MAVRTDSIVLLRDGDDWCVSKYRVEEVDGSTARVRNLDSFLVSIEFLDDLRVLYQVDTFDPGDTVRIHEDYADRYNEADGENDLTVVLQNANKIPTTMVENNSGIRFNVLNERLYLVKPAKAFKAGDKVVVDRDLSKKYDNDGTYDYWSDAGVLVLTEDSGSRYVKTTSNVRREKDGRSVNVPTRWLKLYEEPAKRVVGETIKAEDIKVGDKVKASFEMGGLLYEFTGVVASTLKLTNEISVHAKDDDGAFGSAFPRESRGAVYTLLEEAPEPVDENLQRLLDAEVGDIAHSTYAHEYWKKVGDDEWMLLELDAGFARTTAHVFGSFYKMKYGTLVFYRKVEDAD